MSETDLVIDPRETGLLRLDLRQLFGNDRRVVLEIGSGKGRFLVGSAMEQPDVNFIGIEKSLHYHRVIAEPVWWDKNALAADGVVLVNRVKPHTDFRGRFESGLLKMLVIGLGKRQGADQVHSYGTRGLRDMMPDASLSEIHIYFPDPWPRTREQKRRIIRAEALAEMRRTLVKGGSGIYVTDHRQYFEIAAPLIAECFPSERRIPTSDDPPRTNYEAKYRAEGREIYEVRFWKE